MRHSSSSNDSDTTEEEIQVTESMNEFNMNDNNETQSVYFAQDSFHKTLMGKNGASVFNVIGGPTNSAVQM